jgi:hypothetical protein
MIFQPPYLLLRQEKNRHSRKGGYLGERKVSDILTLRNGDGCEE